MALTHKQKLFVRFYLGDARGNATKAARLAGYAGADHTLAQVGSENLTKPDIAEAIAEFYRRKAMSAEEVLGRIAEEARGIEGYLRVEHGVTWVDLESLVADGKEHLVKKLSYTDKGQLQVEFYDAQAALVHIGRNLKLWTDKTEQAVTIDGILGYRITPPDGADSGPGDGDSGEGT